MRIFKATAPLSKIIPILLVLITCAMAFCFQFIVTSGPSMEPTYCSGDLLLKIFPYRQPQVGDVVIARQNGLLVVKRVAAVAGQEAIVPDIHRQDDTDPNSTSIHYTELSSEACLRGFELWGDYLYWYRYSYWADGDSVTVPEGYIFLVGDNFDESYDSREPGFGLVPIENIEGFILFTILEGDGHG